MKVIERATKHYHSQEKLVILVPEWGDETGPLEVHIFPMTMSEVNTMQKMNRKKVGGMEQAVNLIIVKARDKDGNRLFSLQDHEALMQNVDYQVVERIATGIKQRFFSDVETQKGNSEETHSGAAS